ncbi:unnamed protein product [Acanthosepion pharaonis]|uniref:Uncharacterized protein n=1 Tax=Acanthosepion pharaonis TaxID=158019 RepID=A0A812EUP7_ACAPH|nr:unnamed protein product [Sepia pharaonis]
MHSFFLLKFLVSLSFLFRCIFFFLVEISLSSALFLVVSALMKSIFLFLLHFVFLVEFHCLFQSEIFLFRCILLFFLLNEVSLSSAAPVFSFFSSSDAFYAFFFLVEICFTSDCSSLCSSFLFLLYLLSLSSLKLIFSLTVPVFKIFPLQMHSVFSFVELLPLTVSNAFSLSCCILPMTVPVSEIFFSSDAFFFLFFHCHLHLVPVFLDLSSSDASLRVSFLFRCSFLLFLVEISDFPMHFLFLVEIFPFLLFQFVKIFHLQMHFLILVLLFLEVYAFSSFLLNFTHDCSSLSFLFRCIFSFLLNLLTHDCFQSMHSVFLVEFLPMTVPVCEIFPLQMHFVFLVEFLPLTVSSLHEIFPLQIICLFQSVPVEIFPLQMHFLFLVEILPMTVPVCEIFPLQMHFLFLVDLLTHDCLQSMHFTLSCANLDLLFLVPVCEIFPLQMHFSFLLISYLIDCSSLSDLSSFLCLTYAFVFLVEIFSFLLFQSVKIFPLQIFLLFLVVSALTVSIFLFRCILSFFSSYLVVLSLMKIFPLQMQLFLLFLVESALPFFTMHFLFLVVSALTVSVCHLSSSDLLFFLLIFTVICSSCSQCICFNLSSAFLIFLLELYLSFNEVSVCHLQLLMHSLSCCIILMTVPVFLSSSDASSLSCCYYLFCVIFCCLSCLMKFHCLLQLLIFFFFSCISALLKFHCHLSQSLFDLSLQMHSDLLFFLLNFHCHLQFQSSLSCLSLQMHFSFLSSAPLDLFQSVVSFLFRCILSFLLNS